MTAAVTVAVAIDHQDDRIV